MSHDLFEQLLGRWVGQCRTWFEPNKLADESEMSGDIVSVLDGRFLRHDYRSTIQGKPRRGEELIAFNSVTKRFQIAWVDDFHMNYAVMFSEGEGGERGFRVQGEYDIAAGEPRWGWRTEYQLSDGNQLRITAYNITPDGDAAKAIEVDYHRAAGGH